MLDAINSSASALNVSSSVAAINAHNVANVNTPSFRSRLAHLSDMSRGGVRLSAVRVNNNNGYLIPSGNMNDIAIIGNDEGIYSNGYGSGFKDRFNIDELGNLRSQNGDILFTGAAGNLRLDSEGNLFSKGELIGRIEAFDNNITGGEQLLQGFIMGSNVNLASEMVTNMTNLRYFQFNALSLKTSDEMIGTVLDIKG